MASHALIIFILFLCASIYTEVKCDSTCSNMLECTMYNLQQVGSKVDGMQSNMAAIANQLSQIQVQIATDKEEMPQQMGTDEEKMQQQMATEIEEMLQQLAEEMQQQMAIEREEMQQQMAADKEEMQQQVETEIEEMQQQMAIDKEEMQEQMETEIEKMQQEIVSQKEEIQNLTLKLESHLSEENRKPEKEELSSYVSFTAYATKTRNYQFGDHLLFDATLRNYGSAYLVNVSEFICPMNAYYLISISLLADSGNWMYGRIMLGDEELGITKARDGSLASQMVVTYCAAGQRIWVKCYNSSNNRMFGKPSRPYSTFSATLIRIT